MNQFNMQLFKLKHRSAYTRQDIDILDDYRTIANIGIIKQLPSHTKLVEIDITKDYTSTFINIKRNTGF